MIRLFLLLATFSTGNCVKQQYDMQERKDNTAVNAARYVRSSTCVQRQLNDQCDERTINANDTVCEDNGSPIGNTLAYIPNLNCCCEPCPYNGTTSDGVGAETLNVTWLASTSNVATLVVNWTRGSSGDEPAGYQLWIFVTGNGQPATDYENGKSRCTCLPPSTTSYTAPVSLTIGFSIHVKLLSIVSQPCGSDSDDQNVLSIVKVIPAYCWDLQGASVEKCGPMLPSVPQNLTVTSRMMNESTVILQITWQPPALYDPDINAYRVSINDEDYCINGTTLQYSTIRSADVLKYIVKVLASSGAVTRHDTYDLQCDDTCCLSNDENEACISMYNCWSPQAAVTHTVSVTTSSSSTTTMMTSTMVTSTMETYITISKLLSTSLVQSSVVSLSATTSVSPKPSVSSQPSVSSEPSVSSKPNVSPEPSVSSKPNVSPEPSVVHGSHISVTIILVVTITIAVILLVVLAAAIIRYLYKRKMNFYELAQSIPSNSRAKVFIIVDKELQLIRKLCHHLAAYYEIDQTYYQFVENDRDGGPGQLGTGAWIEKSFNESTMVLFVCNKGFKQVWENTDNDNGQDPYAQIISTTKRLFHVCLAENNLSKFAVILLERSDYEHIPCLLRSVKSFPIDDEEALARYILQVPTHVPP